MCWETNPFLHPSPCILIKNLCFKLRGDLKNNEEKGRWSDGMRCCRRDWPWLCFVFINFRILLMLTRKLILGYFGFINFPSPPPHMTLQTFSCAVNGCNGLEILMDLPPSLPTQSPSPLLLSGDGILGCVFWGQVPLLLSKLPSLFWPPYFINFPILPSRHAHCPINPWFVLSSCVVSQQSWFWAFFFF